MQVKPVLPTAVAAQREAAAVADQRSGLVDSAVGHDHHVAIRRAADHDTPVAPVARSPVLRHAMRMTITLLIARYGLLALFVGSGIEGEAVVVTGGILAHKGMVPLWGAMLVSALGSCLADQLWFFAGRYCRRYRWVQALMEKPAFARAVTFLERHPTAFIFGFRFVYGMRTASPIAIGTTHIPARTFVPLNMLSAAVWGPLFTLLGYGFGRAIDPVLQRLQSGFVVALLCALAAGALSFAILWLVRRRGAARRGRGDELDAAPPLPVTDES
jgi:membrane protein DedA with SNARE-associated domain